MLQIAFYDLLVSVTRAAPLLAKQANLEPVITSDFPDPSIIQVGTTWYAFASPNEYDQQKVKVQVATSEDFKTWKLSYDALVKLPTCVQASDPVFWAPSVSQFNWELSHVLLASHKRHGCADIQQFMLYNGCVRYQLCFERLADGFSLEKKNPLFVTGTRGMIGSDGASVAADGIHLAFHGYASQEDVGRRRAMYVMSIGMSKRSIAVD